MISSVHRPLLVYAEDDPHDTWLIHQAIVENQMDVQLSGMVYRRLQQEAGEIPESLQKIFVDLQFEYRRPSPHAGHAADRARFFQ